MIRNLLYPLAYPIRKRQILKRWVDSGRPAPPPPYFKHDLLRQLAAERPHLATFVETGTWKADTLFQLRKHFAQLHSIELDSALFTAAEKRLARYRHIRLWQGHSAECLSNVLQTLSTPTLFWLDAHYMRGGLTGFGVCPVMQELTAIFTHLNEPDGHLILIDDARNFKAAGDYPSLQEVEDYARTRWPSYRFSIQNDIIFLSPSST